MKLISIVVPVYNEENNISLLITKLNNLDFRKANLKKEIIIINDGSTDNIDNFFKFNQSVSKMSKPAFHSALEITPSPSLSSVLKGIPDAQLNSSLVI